MCTCENLPTLSSSRTWLAKVTLWDVKGWKCPHPVSLLINRVCVASTWSYQKKTKKKRHWGRTSSNVVLSISASAYEPWGLPASSAVFTGDAGSSWSTATSFTSCFLSLGTSFFSFFWRFGWKRGQSRFSFWSNVYQVFRNFSWIEQANKQRAAFRS